jgi:hypothetical protein
VNQWVYPDFKAFHRQAPDVRPASKKSHIDQNFYILKKNYRANRSEDCDCQSAFCFISFSNFNSTQMRVHFNRRESQGSVRVTPCKNVLCLLLAKISASRASVNLPSQEKRKAARITLYNRAAQLSRTETKRERKAAEEELCKDVNPLN